MRRGDYGTNRAWIVGADAFVELATKSHPFAVALIDAADLGLVLDGRGRWRAGRCNTKHSLYVWRYQGPRASREHVLLHRFLLNLQPGDALVDHVNRDPLDNRRRNLRLATPTQNNVNRPPAAGSLKGIALRPNGRWHAQIRLAGTQHHLGSFGSAREAAIAYDAAARALHGSYAFTNFPQLEGAA